MLGIRSMRQRFLRRSLTAGLLVGFALPAIAGDVVWDISPGAVGPGDSAITGGGGAWDTSTGNWTVDGGVNNIVWNNSNNDVAVFGGTAGTVALGTAITAG